MTPLAASDYSMADATRRMIDEERQHIADEAHRRAERMVAAHRPLLEAFAARLLEDEVLERADIERITAEYEGEAVPRLRLEPLPGTGTGRATVAASKRLEPPL